MTSVLIVVLNWNGIDDTEKCVASLQKLSYPNFKIVIVDNGSVDDSLVRLDKIKKKHTNITVISNPKNLGFAGGVNTGIKYGIAQKFDAIALFNNDAVVDKDWLTNLVLAFEKQRAGIVTGKLLHTDGETIDSTGDFYTTWGIPSPRARNKPTHKAPESGFVFGASGGASLYKTSLFQEIGLFDETFFAYYEDVDISFRAQLAGHKIYYEASAVAYHEQGGMSW